jgi:hypothetical protein
MPALRRVRPAAGAEAMQQVNRLIQNPLFLLVFMGTGLVCLPAGWSGKPGARPTARDLASSRVHGLPTSLTPPAASGLPLRR